MKLQHWSARQMPLQHSPASSHCSGASLQEPGPWQLLFEQSPLQHWKLSSHGEPSTKHAQAPSPSLFWLQWPEQHEVELMQAAPMSPHGVSVAQRSNVGSQ